MTSTEFLQKLSKENFLQLRGLITTLVFSSSAAFGVVVTYNKTFVYNQIPLIGLFAILIAINVLIITLWVFLHIKRRYIPSRRDRFNVAIAINPPRRSQDIFEETKDKFIKKFEEIDQFNHFNVFELHHTPQFRTANRAEKFIDEQDIQLLIWGDTNTGNENGEEVLEFNLKFTYDFPSKPKLSDKELEENQQEMQSFIGGRDWKILRSHSFIQIKVISSNLTEVSLYIVIQSLVSARYLLLAFEYLNKLINGLRERKKRDDFFPGFDSFYKQSTELKADLANILAYIAGRDGNYDEVIKFANDALTVRENDLNALIFLARAFWIKGCYDESFQFAMRAKKHYPQELANKYNEAYFAIVRSKNYSKAVKIYRKLPKEQSLDIWMIIDFLENEYDKTKDPALLFAAGYLNVRFMDETRGWNLLASFKKMSKKADKYKPMLEEMANLKN